ncbi:uncharacterized protein MELLADRAFT_93716 [Melampsora larici-populina 98AG31]|uniref:No apical meristem-associated C-terminal domain-containing protein n=1 Tax=Melampsora larici-populina (strain 98AG31 / pathotype 3-4-7) TaxID=747676 RepID=F4S504_MELLP|nr:uncharacterized protein MELLADRAFT_93716 [Melampsora larici-populina 98AG31]EGG00288.1 hypothetical protein MELLADRAFT_93716 [Melampsora larici-populina 98AG31]
MKQTSGVIQQALRLNGNWTQDKEDEIRALAAKTTEECLRARCPYYNYLQPIMGNRASNEPIFAADSGNKHLSRAASIMDRPPSPPANESQGTQFSGWDPTQNIDIELNQDTFKEIQSQANTDLTSATSLEISGPDDCIAISQSAESNPEITSDTSPALNERMNLTSIQHSSHPMDYTSSSESFPRPNSKPRLNVSQKLNQTNIDSPRRSDTNDFQEMKNDIKASIRNGQSMMQEASANSSSLFRLLETKYGKRDLEDEDLCPEAMSKKKAKKDKQEELELLKLDRELAQERKALAENNQGSGLSKLDLAREKVDMITKFCAVGVSLDDAERKAEEILNSLK